MSDIEAIRKRDAEISWDRIPSTTDRFAYITYAEDDRHKLLEALDEAQAEVERLRGVLREIAEEPDWSFAMADQIAHVWRAAARAALEAEGREEEGYGTDDVG